MTTRNVFAQTLAALLLAAVTVVLPAGTAQAQQAGTGDQGKKEADLARRLDEARKDAEKAKAEAAELRERLEKERQRAIDAEREARAERDAARKAEAEARRQAQQALAAEAAARQEAEKALADAKKKAEQALYAAQLRAAQQEWEGKEKAKGELKPSSAALQQAKEKLLNQFNMKRAELVAQLKHLDAEQQKVLGELERQAVLVQILERLERIERRLDQLGKHEPAVPQRTKK
jgi:colicin import membrane protein